MRNDAIKRSINLLNTSFTGVIIKTKMRCPYPECQKDYNDDAWPSVYDSYVNPTGFNQIGNGDYTLNRVYVITKRCRFCFQYFHEIFVGHENEGTWDETLVRFVGNEPTRELVASYPSSKTKFKSKAVPVAIREFFNEAERCRSIGAMTGVAACLRKTVYAVCDQQKVSGANYKEKIGNLPVTGDVYKELLKQIKFLGDNGTKPSGDSYTSDQVDIALSTLPVVIDKIYEQDETISEAEKVLASARSKGAQKAS